MTTAPEPPLPLASEDAAAASALWFELDDPDERDALLERLAASDWDGDIDFFAHLLAQPGDPGVAEVAADALLARGHPAGLVWLEARLADDEVDVFAGAAFRLARALGPGAYPRLAAIWGDGRRDRAVRREALAAALLADPPTARAAILAALADPAGPLPPDAEELEICLWALVDVPPPGLGAALAGLAARLRGAGEAGAAALVLVEAARDVLAAA